MRTLTALVLSLILAIASVSMATARGQTSMGLSVTICDAQGTSTLVLGPNGQPFSKAPHLCPDCISASTVFTLTRSPVLPPPPLRPGVQIGQTQPDRHVASADLQPHHARDPPAISV